jgi:hypothetical protein
MKRTFVVSALLTIVVSMPASADRPAMQREYTISSSNGKYEFTMYPSNDLGGSQTAPRGEAFEVSDDGTREQLWQVVDWYAFETFLANDGRGLVRMGPWASSPPHEELALAFYRDGAELRRYVVGDLIDDEDTLEHSVSHYRWLARDARYPRILADGRFELRTIEDRVVAFDVTTGAMLAAKPATAAASQSIQVIREDVDDPFFAMNLFRENGIDMDEARIASVIRSGHGTVVLVNDECAGLTGCTDDTHGPPDEAE